jgi:DNA-binding transcriptional LysR family regulator
MGISWVRVSLNSAGLARRRRFPIDAQGCANMHSPMAGPVPLDWDDLRYFLRAVQAKTLAGAARTMGVEHTTLGRRLSSLERAIGASLMLRGPEGLRLTVLGEKAAPLVADVERSVQRLLELIASEKTRVRLALPSGMTRYFTAGISKLCQDNPGLSLELVSGARPVDLMRGEADLAIRSGPVLTKELVTRKLCESGWSLYAAESYVKRKGAPKDPNDLSGHEVIGYDQSLAGVPAAQWLEARSAKATVVLRSREMTDMGTAAVSGLGLAVLPCGMGSALPTLRRLTDRVVATRMMSLVYRREAKLSPDVRAVIRFVIQTMQSSAAEISGKIPAKT